MKRISKIDLTLMIPVTSALLVLVGGCQDSSTSNTSVAELGASGTTLGTESMPKENPTAKEDCCKSDALTSSAPGPQPTKLEVVSQAPTFPDVTLVNQDGQPMKLGRDLGQDKLLVMNFIFTTCKGVCPPMGVNFGQLQGRLGDRLGRDVNLVSISVDPVTDTPERLKTWGKQFGASAGWTLLTGQKQDVDHLLKALGVFAANKTEHSPFVLIGRISDGRWQRIHGLTSADKLADEILRLVDAPERAQSDSTLSSTNSARNEDSSTAPAAQRYFTNVLLTDQNGTKMRLYSDVLKGKVVVITPFFTSCRATCPHLIDTFVKLQSHFEDRLGKDLLLVSVTVDPDTDTPDKLKAYAAQYHALPGWYFLTGDKADVLTALAKLGQRIKVKEDHSNIFLIGNDKTGLWKKAMGLAPPAEIIRIVESVLNDKPS
jgi:protein SCO1